MQAMPVLRQAAALLGLCLLVCNAACAAEADARPASRAEATGIIADMRRIVTDEGVERLEKVRIGGIDQWVSIRGNDRDNPVLLMLHGGPGWVAMPTSWYFQRGWEEYFTVVQWDQRGAGKTYVENDPAAVAPTMTRERMVADAVDMVDWLRREFDRDRIFVVGHSWGSYLGLELARRKPQWLHAYIGIGQVTDAPESERRGWAWTLGQARRDGNDEAVAELESLAPYAQGDTPVPLADLMKQRRWLNFYGGMVHNRTGGQAEAAAIRLAPEYSDRDVAQVWTANDFSAEHLLSDALTLDMGSVTGLDVPLLLLLGRHDHNVSSRVAAEWFERVQAPSKQLVWFEHSAHEVMIEEPGKTLLSLVRYALPFASPAADVRTGDVTRFFQVLDAADGRPTAQALQDGYLDAGTVALREFADSRIGDAEHLARAIEDRPELFATARSCAAALPDIQERVLLALDRLDGLLPSARFPPVTVVVGRGTTGGVTTPAGVVIGLEALCGADWMQPDITDRFVHLIAHEYVHVQQPGAAVEVAEPTVLYQAWLEGGAEFVGELISGAVANVHLQSWVQGRECALEREFLADADSTDLSAWLYNGPGDEARRGDLGYWVGYRLARAYYDRARDKQQAIAEMLSVTPPSARTLLDASGWQPACGPAGG